MKAPFAFYCPACNHRQQYGKSGDKLEFPATIKCDGCHAEIVLEKSESGGVHVRAVAPASK